MMKIGVLTKIVRDEVGAMEEPVVRAFWSRAAAEDAMIKEFAEVKSKRYPRPKDLYAEVCESESSYLMGTDDTDVSWFVNEVEVEE